MSNDIAVLQQDIYEIAQPRFHEAAVDQSINFEREAGFAMQLLERSSYLASVAMKNRQSLVDSVVNVAALGISLNPANKHAYLVPRDGRICLDVSYMGLMHLAIKTGAVRWAQARLFYADDVFKLRGIDEQPLHEYDPFAKDRGELRGVYCVVKTRDGDYLTHCMAIDDVYAIRNRSEAWKKGQKGPWATDEGEMIKKTCVKQGSKYWPSDNDRLLNAIHHINTDGDEGLGQLDDGGEEPAGRKPTVAMPQARSARGAAPADISDADPRPVSDRNQAPDATPSKPAAGDTTPATPGEIAWIRNKLAKLSDSRGVLQKAGIDLGADLAGMTKGQFAAIKRVLA